MIKEHHIEKVRGGMLVDIYTGGNILGFITTRRLLQSGLSLLREHTTGTRWKKLGSFGRYHVTLVVPASEPVSLFVDGPVVAKPRNLSAAITLDRGRLVSILSEALQVAKQRGTANGSQPFRRPRSMREACSTGHDGSQLIDINESRRDYCRRIEKRCEP